MSGRNRMILSIGGVVLILLLGYFFLIRSRQAALTKVKDQVAAEESKTAALRAELARREELQQREPQLRAELARQEELVPPKDNVADFIFQVEEAAEDSGIDFVQITPELPRPPLEGAAVAQVRVTINASGGYFALQDFIRRLYGNVDRAVRIDVLNLTPNEQAGTAGALTMNSNARIFFQLPEAPVDTSTAAPAPAPAATPEATTTTTTP